MILPPSTMLDAEFIAASARTLALLMIAARFLIAALLVSGVGALLLAVILYSPRRRYRAFMRFLERLH
jgi:hypothetical protein